MQAFWSLEKLYLNKWATESQGQKEQFALDPLTNCGLEPAELRLRPERW